MEIINRYTGEVYDIKNIDFNAGVVFGTSQAYQWANKKSDVKVLETDTEFKSLVEELTAQEILNLPQYADYCKLSDYTGEWYMYPDCVQRCFVTKDDIVYFSINNPEFIVQMRMTEPLNKFVEYETGTLVYFYTILTPDIVYLLNSRGIVVENRPENCNVNGKLETPTYVPKEPTVEFLNPQPEI